MTVVVKPDSILYPDNYSQFVPYRGTSNIVENGDMRISRIWADNVNIPLDARNQPLPIIDGWTWKYFAFLQTTPYGVFKPSTDVPAGTEYLRSLVYTGATAGTVSNANGYAAITWRSGIDEIEHLKWGTAQAKTAYLHFWVKSSAVGTHSVTIHQLIASSSLKYVATYTISAANTWERKTITIPGPTSATWQGRVNLEILFPMAQGTGGYTSSPNTWLTVVNNTSTYMATGSVEIGKIANANFSITGVHMDTINSTAFTYKIDNQKDLSRAIEDMNRYMMVYGGKGALSTPTWYANGNINVALFETDSGNMSTVFFRPRNGFASFPTLAFKYWDQAPTAYFHNGAGSFNPNSQSWFLGTSTKDTARVCGTGVTLTTGYGGYISGGYNGQCVFVAGI